MATFTGELLGGEHTHQLLQHNPVVAGKLESTRRVECFYMVDDTYISLTPSLHHLCISPLKH